jgi:phage/plasmid-like protein (TIGR03299 family)
VAHQFDTGFTVRIPAWHGLGNVLGDAPATWAEARDAAGLLWEPAEDVIYRRVRIDLASAPAGSLATADPDVVMVPLAEHKLIQRNDTGAELSVQRTAYPIIHHATMGDLLEVLAAEAGTALSFDSVGSLQGGRKVYAVARLDEPFQVPGDSSATYPYFALQNAHDGEGACRIIPTQVRIVCMNTWQLASTQATYEVVIRHQGNVDQAVEAAKLSLASGRAAAAEYRTTMTELAGLRYDDAVLATFLERFIPTPEGATERLLVERADRRNLCRAMLAESPTLAELPPTAYQLVQLVGEYTDHLRKLPTDTVQRQEIYLRRTMLGDGDGARTKAAVVGLARELCTVGA